MQIYGWGPHGVYYHPGKSCDDKHCDIADIMFWFVAWPLMNRYLKGYVNLWVDACHSQLSHCHVWWSWSGASENIKYSICHLTSKHHVMEGSSTSKSYSSSWYVTTLQILVAIGIVVVEI